MSHFLYTSVFCQYYLIRSASHMRLVTCLDWHHYLTSRTHYAGEIKTMKFYSCGYSYRLACTNPGRENGAFERVPQTARNLEMPAFLFRVDETHFEKRAFRRRHQRHNHVISLHEFSSNTNPK